MAERKRGRVWCSPTGALQCPRNQLKIMNKQNNQKLTPYAKKLRREMTKEERHLWYDFLRDLPEMVHRQKTVGPYIVDFYVASVKIVIELDGGQHYEPKGVQEDQQRDQYLMDNGCTVLRYSNADVMKRFHGVCEDILQKIEAKKSV